MAECIKVSKKLAKKLRDAKRVLEKQLCEGKKPNLTFLEVDGKPYFSLLEIGYLNALGTVRYLISLDEEFMLEQKIEESFMKEIEKVEKNKNNERLHNECK